MGRGRRCGARSDRGAVAVEFALVMPLLLLLVFGIIDFGWMLNRDTLVDNASRDGVRVASLDGTFAQVCTAVKNELSDSGIAAPTSCDAASDPTTITIDCVKADGTPCRATPTTYDTLAIEGTTAVVTVTYVHTWITPLMTTFLGSTKTLTEKTQMVVE